MLERAALDRAWAWMFRSRPRTWVWSSGPGLRALWSYVKKQVTGQESQISNRCIQNGLMSMCIHLYWTPASKITDQSVINSNVNFTLSRLRSSIPERPESLNFITLRIRTLLWTAHPGSDKDDWSKAEWNRPVRMADQFWTRWTTELFHLGEQLYWGRARIRCFSSAVPDARIKKEPQNVNNIRSVCQKVKCPLYTKRTVVASMSQLTFNESA